MRMESWSLMTKDSWPWRLQQKLSYSDLLPDNGDIVSVGLGRELEVRMDLDERGAVCAARQRLHVWLEDILPQRDPHLGRPRPRHAVTRRHHVPGVHQGAATSAVNPINVFAVWMSPLLTCLSRSWCKPARGMSRTRPRPRPRSCAGPRSAGWPTPRTWGRWSPGPTLSRGGRNYPGTRDRG